MLVRNESILNVWTSDFDDIGYDLKKDGWLNNFADAKKQSMREDRVPWSGAHKNHPEFFSIIFPALMDNDDIIIDWQCDVGWFFMFLFLMFYFFHTYAHLVAFHYFRLFCHCIPLHSTPYYGI